MSASFRSALLGAAAVLVVATGHADAHAAGAQERPVVVAGQDPGPRLTVADTVFEGSQRLELSLGDTTDGLGSSASDAPPLWPDEVIVTGAVFEGRDGVHRMVVGGVVSAGAASVELRFASGQLLRLPTLAGDAYTGRSAGRVRFFFGEIALDDRGATDLPAPVRMLDGAGAVIGVARSPELTRSVELLRRQAGATRIAFSAVLTSRLEPRLLAPEHRADGLCLVVTVRPPVREQEAACQEADRPVTLGLRRGCGPVPTLLAGFVPQATHRLVLRLGSGRLVRLPTGAAPFGRAGRIVMAQVPRGEAVRRAWAVDADERTLATVDTLVAPPDRRCEPAAAGGDFPLWDFVSAVRERRLGVPPDTQVAATSGATRLLVRDADDDLCVGIDQLDLDGGDCRAPRLNAHREGRLHVDPERGIVAGVYPAQVAGAELRLRGGGRMRLPTTEAPGYTGRYQGAVRFLLAPIPRGRTVVGAALLDAVGRAIGTVELDGPGTDLTLIGKPSTVRSVGSGNGRVRLVVGAKANPVAGGELACLGLAFGRAVARCDDELDVIDVNSVTARVICGPRRTVVFGIARHTISRVEITLANGRRVRPRLVRFPRASRSSVFLAVFPRDVAVTRARFIGRRASDAVALSTKQPSRQCGYVAGGVRL